MAFITPSDVVARLINSMETIPRCLTGFYHVTNHKPCYQATQCVSHILSFTETLETVRLVNDIQYSIADALVQLFLHKKTPKSILLDTHVLRLDYA